MSANPFSQYELWPAESRPGSFVFVPDGHDGGVVVGRVWQSGRAWYGQAAAGCGDRRWHVTEACSEAAEVVIRQWLDAGQPDARKTAEAAAERQS